MFFFFFKCRLDFFHGMDCFLFLIWQHHIFEFVIQSSEQITFHLRPHMTISYNIAIRKGIVTDS